MDLTFKFQKIGISASKDKVEEAVPQQRDVELYADFGKARQITFVDKDGKETSLYYNDLRKVEFLPENNTLTLYFVNDTATLVGNNIDTMKDDMILHRVKKVKAIDKRHLATRGEDEIVIYEMSIK